MLISLKKKKKRKKAPRIYNPHLNSQSPPTTPSALSHMCFIKPEAIPQKPLTYLGFYRH